MLAGRHDGSFFSYNWFPCQPHATSWHTANEFSFWAHHVASCGSLHSVPQSDLPPVDQSFFVECTIVLFPLASNADVNLLGNYARNDATVAISMASNNSMCFLQRPPRVVIEMKVVIQQPWLWPHRQQQLVQQGIFGVLPERRHCYLMCGVASHTTIIYNFGWGLPQHGKFYRLWVLFLFKHELFLVQHSIVASRQETHDVGSWAQPDFQVAALEFASINKWINSCFCIMPTVNLMLSIQNLAVTYLHFHHCKLGCVKLRSTPL